MIKIELGRKLDIIHKLLKSTDCNGVFRSDMFCPRCRRQLVIPLGYDREVVSNFYKGWGNYICVNCEKIWDIEDNTR